SRQESRLDKKYRFVAAAIVASFAAASLAAQSKSSIPRTKDGHPDLQGTYDLAMLTPVERAAGSPLVLTDEDAKKGERQALARKVSGDAPLKGDRPAPPLGGDGSAGPAGNVGGYNSLSIDAGSRYTAVDGGTRASLLLAPPDAPGAHITPVAAPRH